MAAALSGRTFTYGVLLLLNTTSIKNTSIPMLLNSVYICIMFTFSVTFYVIWLFKIKPFVYIKESS